MDSLLATIESCEPDETADIDSKAKLGSTTVTDVSTNWGFWHFGEFSRAYKNCFGEVPSKTLKTNSGN